MDSLAELRTLIARHAGSEHARAILPDIMLGRITAPTLPLGDVTEPVFGLVAQGAKRAVLGDRVFDYGVGEYLIVGVDLPLVANVTDASATVPFLGFGFTLNRAAIARLLLDAGFEGDRSAPPGIATSKAEADLLDPIIRLLRLLDQPGDARILAPGIEREILWRLVNGDQGMVVRQLGLADSRLSQIGRAVRWIRAHHAEALRIDALARIADMSATSFFRHFRAITSLTPIQYQKQVRLQEARARLMIEPGHVAAVGFAVGYDSPSQFSREYRRLFGTPPTRDVALLQAQSSSYEKDRE